MSRTHVPKALRERVAAQARYRAGYHPGWAATWLLSENVTSWHVSTETATPFPTLHKVVAMIESGSEAKTWTDLLAKIRKRPAMYLGAPNLQALHMLLTGFSVAEDFYAIPEASRQKVNDFPWKDFEAQVSDRHNNPRLSLSSFGLAQYEAQGKNLTTFDSSEEYPGAWEIWWTWYDEFHQTIQNSPQQ